METVKIAEIGNCARFHRRLSENSQQTSIHFKTTEWRVNISTPEHVMLFPSHCQKYIKKGSYNYKGRPSYSVAKAFEWVMKGERVVGVWRRSTQTPSLSPTLIFLSQASTQPSTYCTHKEQSPSLKKSQPLRPQKTKNYMWSPAYIHPVFYVDGRKSCRLSVQLRDKT